MTIKPCKLHNLIPTNYNTRVSSQKSCYRQFQCKNINNSQFHGCFAWHKLLFQVSVNSGIMCKLSLILIISQDCVTLQITHQSSQTTVYLCVISSVSTWYLENLVGTAHGGDFVVGVGSSQLAQVTHGSSADLTVHVHLLHLMFWTHEHLRYINNNKLKHFFLKKKITDKILTFTHLTVF